MALTVLIMLLAVMMITRAVPVAALSVVLSSKPSASVGLTCTSSDTGVATLGSSSMVFSVAGSRVVQVLGV